MRIGIDFDNTIVCYDEAFVEIGKEGGFLAPDFHGADKTDVRKAIRAQENGEYHWQRLQGLVYGKRIHRARLFDGVASFIGWAARTPQTQVYIVSHKTELAHHDPDKTNLRNAALGFLKDRNFFSDVGLAREHVFFEATREEKIARIIALQCDVFIDDLPEVLLDTAFPERCKKLLFSSQPHAGLLHFPAWADIHAHLLDA